MTRANGPCGASKWPHPPAGTAEGHATNACTLHQRPAAQRMATSKPPVMNAATHHRYATRV